MRLVALAVAVVLCSAPAWPQSGPTHSTIQLTGTGATVTSFAGTSREVSSSTNLLDLDTIATGINGSAKVVSSTGWTAELGASTRAVIRTVPIAGGPSPIFARVLDLSEGSLTWSVAKGAMGRLDTPVGSITAQDATQVKISYSNGLVSVVTQWGESTFSAGSTYLAKLPSGQMVDIGFDAVNNVFYCKVLGDGDPHLGGHVPSGPPVDFVIGKTVVRADKGDEFQTKVDHKHADVRVLKGSVDVKGPDGLSQSVGVGQYGLVINGGVGAVGGPQGSYKKADRSKVYFYAPISMPKWDPRDIWYTRQDISPS
jgi:hypothetical protein